MSRSRELEIGIFLLSAILGNEKAPVKSLPMYQNQKKLGLFCHESIGNEYKLYEMVTKEYCMWKNRDHSWLQVCAVL